jgi:thymidylate kinase
MNSQSTEIFREAATTQIELERTNEENTREIKRKYTELLQHFANRIDEVRINENIKENIKCILKYCGRYIDDVDRWYNTFDIQV